MTAYVRGDKSSSVHPFVNIDEEVHSHNTPFGKIAFEFK